MRALTAPAAAMLALAIAAPAGAATWSPPQDLSSPHLFVDGLGLSVAGDGRALATWRFADPAGNATRSGSSAASRAPGADAFGPERALLPAAAPDRRGQLVEGVAAYGRDRLLVASTRAVGAEQGRIAIGVRTGRADGTLGARRTVRGAGTARRPSNVSGVALAVNASGAAALAWFEDRGVRGDRVYVSLRRAGGRFGAPRRLATGRFRGVAAGIGARGDVLVSWDARGTVRARFKPRSSRDFQAGQAIRSADAYNADMRPLVAPSGRVVLAWSAQRLREGGAPGPAYFQVAVKPAGARRFGRARLLERMAAVVEEDRTIAAVLDSAGAATVAWSGTDGATRRVRAVRSSGTPVQDVSPPGRDAVLSDLAAGPGGRLIAVWDGGIEDRLSTVTAAVASGPGAAFGVPEPISSGTGEARFGVAAFDPASGRPTVLFSDRPAGSGGTVDTVRSFARASRRSE